MSSECFISVGCSKDQEPKLFSLLIAWPAKLFSLLLLDQQNYSVSFLLDQQNYSVSWLLDQQNYSVSWLFDQQNYSVSWLLDQHNFNPSYLILNLRQGNFYWISIIAFPDEVISYFYTEQVFFVTRKYQYHSYHSSIFNFITFIFQNIFWVIIRNIRSGTSSKISYINIFKEKSKSALNPVKYLILNISENLINFCCFSNACFVNAQESMYIHFTKSTIISFANFANINIKFF